MTAWALGGMEDEPGVLKSGEFRVIGPGPNGRTAAATASPIACVVELTRIVQGRKSTVKLSTMIHALEREIDVEATIDWREIGDADAIPGLMVNFSVNTQGHGAVGQYETRFGSVTRAGLPGGAEEPTLRYAHTENMLYNIGDKGAPLGFTLLQDCKYGHAIEGNGEVRLRMIRSSTDPVHAPEVNHHTVRYSMYFHDKPAEPSELTRLGAASNHPLIVLPANRQYGDGITPAARWFVRVETHSVVLTALKQPEDEEGRYCVLSSTTARISRRSSQLIPR